MFGLDMIMIRVGGWDKLVEWAIIVSVIIIGGIKIPRHWNWRCYILEVDTSYIYIYIYMIVYIINFNIILATLDLIYY